MDGGDTTYHPRCLDCGCTAPFDAWQSRTPAPVEVEELLERYKSSWWLLGYEAASHEDYEISEENWAKMNALKSRLLAALTSGDGTVEKLEQDLEQYITLGSTGCRTIAEDVEFNRLHSKFLAALRKAGE